jgi:hypothetical protein
MVWFKDKTDFSPFLKSKTKTPTTTDPLLLIPSQTLSSLEIHTLSLCVPHWFCPACICVPNMGVRDQEGVFNVADMFCGLV